MCAVQLASAAGSDRSCQPPGTFQKCQPPGIKEGHCRRAGGTFLLAAGDHNSHALKK